MYVVSSQRWAELLKELVYGMGKTAHLRPILWKGPIGPFSVSP